MWMAQAIEQVGGIWNCPAVVLATRYQTVEMDQMGLENSDTIWVDQMGCIRPCGGKEVNRSWSLINMSIRPRSSSSHKKKRRVPSDMLMEIAKHMRNARDFITMFSVSKSWNECLQYHSIDIWQHFLQRDFPKTPELAIDNPRKIYFARLVHTVMMVLQQLRTCDGTVGEVHLQRADGTMLVYSIIRWGADWEISVHKSIRMPPRNLRKFMQWYSLTKHPINNCSIIIWNTSDAGTQKDISWDKPTQSRPFVDE